MEKENLLYRYFSNTLTPEEEQLFQSLLETDLDFKASFDFENQVRNAVKDEHNEELRAKLKTFEKQVQTKQPSASSSISYWKIAASVLLIIAASWFTYDTFQSPDYDILYASNYDTYPNTVYVITRGDTVNSLEREAFVAYESGDYETAFAKMEQAQPKNYFSFYKAQALLQIEQTDDAEILLKDIVSKNENFTAQSLWYLALIEIKKGQSKEAKNYLNKLLENHTYKNTEAIALRKALN